MPGFAGPTPTYSLYFLGSLRKIVGIEASILKFLFDECRFGGERITLPIPSNLFEQRLGIFRKTAVDTLRRLYKKNAIARKEFKIGTRVNPGIAAERSEGRSDADEHAATVVLAMGVLLPKSVYEFTAYIPTIGLGFSVWEIRI